MTASQHSWTPTGLITTGKLGGVVIWSKCEHCGMIYNGRRRGPLQPCIDHRPAWLLASAPPARRHYGVPLPPESSIRVAASHSPSPLAWQETALAVNLTADGQAYRTAPKSIAPVRHF